MSEIVYSPLYGKVISITQVNDEMFSEKMLGDGIAIIPREKEVYSPVSGVVSMIFETQHAIGLKTKSGQSVLIHIGIDTVELKGKPFKTKVKVGDHVKQGDLLTVVDWKYIQKKGKDTVVPIVVMGKVLKIIREEGIVKAGDPLFEIL